ncbi:ParB N-terminal domain-containing protein [Paludisphaera borealis]|uniref:ParB N-terminal domain-containing protein n=1 Tax=Paludisphaera borealis TaxID=1387353 RepID=UPI000970B667|nr:ParB N-terminal domain-containing protein [Paludisphaera borealis]
MNVAIQATARPLRGEKAELVPEMFETRRLVLSPDNPLPSPARLAQLEPEIQKHGQRVPGFVFPSPELDEEQRVVLEGAHRMLICQRLGRPFWAFDLGRYVPEEEQIELTFQHNHLRRVMSLDEIVQRAARYIELTRCTAGEAAKSLGISPAKLSRAFGDKRIPAHLRERAEQLGISIRSLIAAAPIDHMTQAVEYAESLGPDGKRRTRDQVAEFIRHLKKGGRNGGKSKKVVSLPFNGRVISVTVAENDTVATVTKDVQALLARLGEHAKVRPDGWAYILQ